MPFNVTISVDDSDFRKLMTHLQRAVPEFTRNIRRELGEYALQTYREQVPVATPRPGREHVGTLRDSVVKMDFPDGFVVTATAPYAKYVAYRTRPHPIFPRKGKRLKFWWNKAGGWVYPRMVNHPGTKANPFHARVARLVKRKMVEIVRKQMERLMRK